MVQRANAIRYLSLAFAGVLMLLAVLAVTARAEYGGLGGLASFTPGRNGGHLEVNPRSRHAFGVAPDGSSYIAESIEVEGKPYFRIQKLASKGEYLAEARVKLSGQPHQLEGVAVDAATQRIYLLVVGERNGEVEQPVFDPEAPVAGELYAFSTEAKAGKLEPAAGTIAGLLAGEKALDSLSEAAGVPLLHPHGIAVDPATHDVLILGQQDVSTKKGLGEETLRAAAQRVHTEGTDAGKLGPRYVDAENCLDEGATIATEPACADGFGQSSSPFVSPGGRLYGERSRELWEIPVAEGASESYEPGSDPKVYEVKPKRLFTMGREQGIEGQEGIVEPASEEEGAGGAVAFMPIGPDEGRIYLDAEITAEEGKGNRSQNRGAAVLDYSEGGGIPTASELGWTAGQNATGENAKCILPLGSEQLLVGADSSGRLLLFDVTAAVLSEHKPATISVLQFGEGGEGCGHAQATPPNVAISGETVTKMRLAEKATLSLNVFEADTQHVEWKFKNDGKEEADEQPVVENYPFPTQMPTFEHEFKHAGNYEITAVIEPDNFAPALEEHSNVTVEGAVIGAEFSYTSSPTIGQQAKFTAKVTDPYKALSHVQYKYVWEFGDGTKAEGSGTREFRAEHAYAGAGLYDVKLTVIDEGGRMAEATHTLRVSAPRASAAVSAPGADPAAGGGAVGGGSGSGAPGPTGTHVSAATLAGTRSLIVSELGGLKLNLACPAQETSCSGTATLRTLTALSTRVKTRAKKSVLTLAACPFTITGGHVQAVTLHLSVRARELLLHMHVLRARMTLLTRALAGAAHTTQAIVTLRLATPSHRRKR
jgi:PKD repeat protein